MAEADASPSPRATIQSPYNPFQSSTPDPYPIPIPFPNSNSTILISESHSQSNSTQPPSNPILPPKTTLNTNPNSAPPFLAPLINLYGAPSLFRPAGAPGPSVSQFTPTLKNPNMQGFPTQPRKLGVLPAGVSAGQSTMVAGQPIHRPPYMAMHSGCMQPPNLHPGGFTFLFNYM